MYASRSRVFWFLLVGVNLLSVLTIAEENSFGQTNAEEEPPPSVTLSRDTSPLPVWGPFRGIVGGVIEVDGKTVARRAFVTAELPGAAGDNRAYPHAKADGYELRFPELQHKDIVPLFGAVYRVAFLTPGKKADPKAPPGANARSGDSVSFQRLPAGKREGRYVFTIPKGAKVTKDTYVFTIGIGGGGRLHGVQLRPSFAKSKDGSDTVTIKQDSYQRQEGNRIVKGRDGPQTVRVGDIVKLAGIKHRVVSITPPDPKQKVIGWFEVSQKPAD